MPKTETNMTTEETNQMMRDALDNFDHEAAQAAADRDKADSPRGWVLRRHEDGRVGLTHKETDYSYTFSADGKTVTKNLRMSYGGRTTSGPHDVATYAQRVSSFSVDKLAVKHYNAHLAAAIKTDEKAGQ